MTGAVQMKAWEQTEQARQNNDLLQLKKKRQKEKKNPCRMFLTAKPDLLKHSNVDVFIKVFQQIALIR